MSAVRPLISRARSATTTVVDAAAISMRLTVPKRVFVAWWSMTRIASACSSNGTSGPSRSALPVSVVTTSAGAGPPSTAAGSASSSRPGRNPSASGTCHCASSVPNDTTTSRPRACNASPSASADPSASASGLM